MALLAVIAVTIPVPPMVVLNAAPITLPVAVIITLSIVARRYPVVSAVGGPAPISVMPPVMTTDGVPISVDPNITGTRSYWPNSNHARWRWWADPDSKVYFSRNCQSSSQKRQGKDFFYHV
jgi:hypothetical protein